MVEFFKPIRVAVTHTLSLYFVNLKIAGWGGEASELRSFEGRASLGRWRRAKTTTSYTVCNSRCPRHCCCTTNVASQLITSDWFRKAPHLNMRVAFNPRNPRSGRRVHVCTLPLQHTPRPLDARFICTGGNEERYTGDCCSIRLQK